MTAPLSALPALGAPLTCGAVTLRDRIAAGTTSAEALTQACLDRIAATEATVQAWAWLDPEAALSQARARDAEARSGASLGPLHGLPVGLKDVIDTFDMPTENGCPADQGRQPARDAELVARLRDAGAVILGKTVTTELAFLAPSRSRNPADPAHTPGGSSAGSAAAVAAGMVPLAVGTQTGGSVIRPAAFCGTVGFKPTFGAIPRAGVLCQSPSLDTIGVFARDVAGAALIAGVLTGRPIAAQAAAPRLGFVQPPDYAIASAQTRAGLEALAARLGPICRPAALPPAFAEAAAVRERINLAEMAYHFADHAARGAGTLAPETADAIARGNGVAAVDYLSALEAQGRLSAALDPLFAQHDVLLAPAAPGPAPRGFATTGNAIFNGLWTLCGTPALTLPLLRGEGGLPVGVQLIAPRGGEEQLIAAALWLESWAAEHGPAPA